MTLIAVSGTDVASADMQKARRNVNLWITKPANPERIAGAILEFGRPRQQGVFNEIESRN